MKEQAKDIIDRSALSDESKSLWHAVLDANDGSLADEFVASIGDDAETLAIATDLLHARSTADTTVEPGFLSEKELRYVETLLDTNVEK